MSFIRSFRERITCIFMEWDTHVRFPYLFGIILLLSSQSSIGQLRIGIGLDYNQSGLSKILNYEEIYGHEDPGGGCFFTGSFQRQYRHWSTAPGIVLEYDLVPNRTSLESGFYLYQYKYSIDLEQVVIWGIEYEDTQVINLTSMKFYFLLKHFIPFSDQFGLSVGAGVVVKRHVDAEDRFYPFCEVALPDLDYTRRWMFGPQASLSLRAKMWNIGFLELGVIGDVNASSFTASMESLNKEKLDTRLRRGFQYELARPFDYNIGFQVKYLYTLNL